MDEFDPLPQPFSEIRPAYSVHVGGIDLPLYRRGVASAKKSVLLVHGASAGVQSFLTPSGNSLSDYLMVQGFDVWMLDWRGSRNVVDRCACTHRDELTIDHVAEHDIPAALTKIREVLKGEPEPDRPLSVFAHCLGSGALAASIGGGFIKPEHQVQSVVLSTLGLFYEMPWYGFLKADNFILERIVGTAPEVVGLHPGGGPRAFNGRQLPNPDSAAGTDCVKHAWPKAMQSAYEIWPPSWLPPHPSSIAHRLAFMFGTPFLKEQLAEGIFDNELLAHFGTIHLILYLHAAQCIRRGFIAPFDAVEHTGSTAGAAAVALASGSRPVRHYLNPEPYKKLQVTLLTGAKNSLWHRGSVDRMYDWLRRFGPERQFAKHVFPNYGHQDLLWGKSSRADVFPSISAAL